MRDTFKARMMEFFNNGDDLIPEGNYEVVIQKATAMTFVSSQYEGIKLMMSIREDTEQTFYQKRVFDNLTLNGAYKIKQIIESLDISKYNNWKSLEDFAELIEGSHMKVYIKHREFNGRLCEQVSRYMKTEMPVETLNEIEQDELVSDLIMKYGMKLDELNKLDEWEIDDYNAHEYLQE